MQNLLIISPYPPKSGKYNHTHSALASFSANLVEGIMKNHKHLKLTVLSDIYKHEKKVFQNKQLTIERIWQKNDPLIYFKLFWKLRSLYLRHSGSDLFIHFEWNVFGRSYYYLILFPFFLLALKMIKIKTYVITHGVIKDVEDLGMYGKLKANILVRGSRLFYFMTSLFSKKVIVTEASLVKKYLSICNNPDKIVFIPHGVDTNLPILKKEKARKLLKMNGDFLTVYFGFLSYYKGPDILVDLFKNQKDLLYLVGGGSKNYVTDISYQKYLKNIYQKAKMQKNIKITGFIKNQAIPSYLNASDLMIFPYRSMLSSSGPLSMSFSFEKPILLSRPLAGYFEGRDFQEALKLVGLRKNNLIFELNANDLDKKLEFAKKNMHKFILFSKIMKEKRSWDIVAYKYLKLL